MFWSFQSLFFLVGKTLSVLNILGLGCRKMVPTLRLSLPCSQLSFTLRCPAELRQDVRCGFSPWRHSTVPSHSASLQAAFTGHAPQGASWDVYLAFSRIPFTLCLRVPLVAFLPNSARGSSLIRPYRDVQIWSRESVMRRGPHMELCSTPHQRNTLAW